MIDTVRNQHDWAVAKYLKNKDIKGGIIGYDKIEHEQLPSQKGYVTKHTLKGTVLLRNVFNAKKFSEQFSFTYYVDKDNTIIVE